MIELYIHELKHGMILAKDVFSATENLKLIAVENTSLTKRVIDRLRDHGVNSVFVVGEREKKIDNLPGAFYFADVPAPKPILPTELKNAALSNLEQLFTIADLDEDNPLMATAFQVVKQLDSVVNQLVASLTSDKDALVNIVDLKSYDEYTYHHSLSVAVLSIAIGQSLHFDALALRELGRCAMMHDIGKTAVPIEIINKPSKLSTEEFAVIQGHSKAGCEYLIRHAIGSEEIWRSVLFHHEKEDGTGYPNGLAGSQIPLWSRIISVADVYDALTSRRPYRNPMQPFETVEYIMGNIGTHFDYDIVLAFMQKIELYPIGSIVELSDRRLATVMDNENALRPVVRTQNGDILDLYSDRNCLSLTITRALSQSDLLARQPA